MWKRLLKGSFLPINDVGVDLGTQGLELGDIARREHDLVVFGGQCAREGGAVAAHDLRVAFEVLLCLLDVGRVLVGGHVRVEDGRELEHLLAQDDVVVEEPALLHVDVDVEARIVPIQVDEGNSFNGTAQSASATRSAVSRDVETSTSIPGAAMRPSISTTWACLPS